MLKIKSANKGIALLITIFFIMLITISLGLGLKYINDASKTMKGELFLFQNSIILDDVLNILKTSPELQNISSANDLFTFLEESSIIPFESNDLNVIIEIQSARSKINPNSLNIKGPKEAFSNFLLTKMINIEYATMLFDLMGKIKPDGGYNTDIFNDNPYLFRDYITSDEHLDELSRIFINKTHEDNLKSINMRELFHASQDINNSSYKIDLNYATPIVWELMLACDEDKATMLSENTEAYEKIEDLLLSEEEELMLNKFNHSFYETYLDITVKITQNNRSSKIRFEYDIKSKKGSNFVFEV